MFDFYLYKTEQTEKKGTSSVWAQDAMESNRAHCSPNQDQNQSRCESLNMLVDHHYCKGLYDVLLQLYTLDRNSSYKIHRNTFEV